MIGRCGRRAAVLVAVFAVALAGCREEPASFEGDGGDSGGGGGGESDTWSWVPGVDSADEPPREPGICGDGEVGYGEVCDGDLTTCADFGYLLGVAVCAADCKAVDLSGCCGRRCGNRVDDDGEVCDGGSGDCADLGGGVGTAPCLDDCSGYMVELCHEPAATCGNGVRDPGELCDGSASACEDLGFLTGMAWCDGTCLRYDTSTCCGVPLSTCGDGVKDEHEACDLDTRPCLELGFQTGTATCYDDCGGYDLSGCCGGGGCGNGMLDPGEVCDTPEATACAARGLGDEGLTTCLPDCSGWDPSLCSTATPDDPCGNEALDDDEICDSDEVPCSEFGYQFGTAECLDDCSGYDLESCGGCTPEEMAAACDGRECGEGDCDLDCGTCPPGHKCNYQGDCVSCGDCAVLGARKCGVANHYDVCVDDGYGCFAWMNGGYCGNHADCVDGDCVLKDDCYPGATTSFECGQCMAKTYTCTASGDWDEGPCEQDGCVPNDLRCVQGGAAMEHCMANCEWIDWMTCDGSETCLPYQRSLTTGDIVGWGDCEYADTCAETGSKTVTCMGGYCEYYAPWGEATCHPYDKVEPCTRSTDGNPCGDFKSCENGVCVEECPGGFECDYWQCIPASQVCDGAPDCDNRADELGCGPCPEDRFLCPDGSCQLYWEYCFNSPGAALFTCFDGSTLDLCAVCDGHDDCPEDEDEAWRFCSVPYTQVEED